MLWSYAGIYCSISPTENLESNVRSRKNVTQCDHSCRTGCILERVSLLIRQFPTYGLREFSRTHIAWLPGTALAACVFRGPAVLRLNHLVFAKFLGILPHVSWALEGNEVSDATDTGVTSLLRVEPSLGGVVKSCVRSTSVLCKECARPRCACLRVAHHRRIRSEWTRGWEVNSPGPRTA